MHAYICHCVCGYAKAGIRNSSGAGGLGHRIMNKGPGDAKPIIAGLPLPTAYYPDKLGEQDQLILETQY